MISISGSSTGIPSAPYICRTCAQNFRRPLVARQKGSAGNSWATAWRIWLRPSGRALHTIEGLARTADNPQPKHPPPAPINRDYLKIPENELCLRWETTPPTPSQLKQADIFFQTQQPEFVWSAAKFRTIDFAGAPEVAFLGRSNIGKSSLLNALLGKNICHTSSKPGRTRTMNGISVHGGKLVVLDMPGYGHGSEAEWGSEIMKYLSARKRGFIELQKASHTMDSLRRAFLLLDPFHGVKATDDQLLSILRGRAIPHQIILSKVDRILFPTGRRPSPGALSFNLSALHKRMNDLRDVVQPRNSRNPPALGEILSCSTEKSMVRGEKLGISGIRWAILSAAGLDGSSSITRSDFVPGPAADEGASSGL